jgi:hypothetical protein
MAAGVADNGWRSCALHVDLDGQNLPNVAQEMWFRLEHDARYWEMGTIEIRHKNMMTMNIEIQVRNAVQLVGAVWGEMRMETENRIENVMESMDVMSYKRLAGLYWLSCVEISWAPALSCVVFCR